MSIDVNQGLTLVRKSNCWKLLKLIIPNYYSDTIVAKRKNLGMVIINKILQWTISSKASFYLKKYIFNT